MPVDVEETRFRRARRQRTTNAERNDPTPAKHENVRIIIESGANVCSERGHRLDHLVDVLRQRMSSVRPRNCLRSMAHRSPRVCLVHPP
jgi:transposase